MKYKTLEELLEAKDNGLVPGSFMLVLDNDDVSGWAGHKDREKVFRSDPDSLLRDLLDYAGLPYDEA